MVEHSAILISQILKASNWHFSFDRWNRRFPPIVRTKQGPDPRGGDVKSQTVVRFHKWRRINKVHFPNPQKGVISASTATYHADPT